MKRIRPILPKARKADAAPASRLVLRLLALAIALSLTVSALLLNHANTMAALHGPVIVKYPASTITSSIGSVVFEKQKYQSFYDVAYTDHETYERTRYPEGMPPAFPNGTSGYYNGTATPDHIVLAGDEARFYGYSSTPYFDYLYSENYEPVGMEFDLTRDNWNFHCFKRTGIFLKSAFTPYSPGSPDGTISGYVLSIGSNRVGSVAQNSAYVMNGSLTQPDLTYALFKVDNMDIDAYNKFITDHVVTGIIPNDNGDPKLDFNNNGTTTMPSSTLPEPPWYNAYFLMGYPAWTALGLSGTVPESGDYDLAWAMAPATAPGDATITLNLGSDAWTLYAKAKAANTDHLFFESTYLGQTFNPPSSTTLYPVGAYDGGNASKLDYYFDGSYGMPKGSSVTRAQHVVDTTLMEMTALTTNLVKLHCRVEIGATIDFYVKAYYENPVTHATWDDPEQLIFSETVDGAYTGNDGFGLYCQYLAHSCQMMTNINFTGTVLYEPDPAKEPTSAKVYFREFGTTGPELEPPETAQGYTGDTYAITPPATIETGGKTYYYLRSDRWSSTTGTEVLDPLTFEEDPGDNETILYYVLQPDVLKGAYLSGTVGIGVSGIGHGWGPVGSMDPSDYSYTTAGAPGSVQASDVIVYKLTIFNPNQAVIPGFGATVTDLLPAGMTLVSAPAGMVNFDSTVNNTYPPAGVKTTGAGGRDLVTWTIPTLELGYTVITVQVQVNSPKAVFENFATVQFDDIPAVNTNSIFLESELQPITIEKEARITEDPGGTFEIVQTTNRPGTSLNPVPVNPGDWIRYTLVVTNPNPTNANVDVVVTDYLPSGLSYISDDAGAVTSTVGTQTLCTWTIPNLPNGVTKITVVTRVDVSSQTFVNWARVTPNAQGLRQEDSDETYHQSGMLPVAVVKDAHRPGEDEYDPVTGDPIFNDGTSASPVPVVNEQYVDYTITVGNPNVSTPVADLNFNYQFTRSFYDGAYTEAQSQLNNGVATPDHVIRNGPNLSFYGYGTTGYMDTLFTDAYNISTLELDFVPGAWNAHCFKRTGIFLKSTIDPYTGLLTGYYLNIGSTNNNLTQVIEPASYQYALFKIENLNITNNNSTNNGASTNIHGFQGRGVTETGLVTTMLASGPLLNLSSNVTQHIRVEIKKDRIQVYVTPDGYSLSPTDGLMFDYTLPTPDNAKGLGFMTQYVSHACTQLTIVKFTNVQLAVATEFPTETTVWDLIPEGMTVLPSGHPDERFGSTDPLADFNVTTDPITGRQLVTWHVDELAPGQTEFYVRVKVDPGREAVTDYENNARVQMVDMGTVVTNSTYHRRTNIMKLHIRQMVIDRNGTTVPLPTLGYYDMENDSTLAGLNSLSGLEGMSNTPFTDYILLLTTDAHYLIETMIPQYYTYAGYVFTVTNTPHSSTARANTGIDLDYTSEFEQWVTVYLIPQEPTGYQTWDTRTNDFGKITVPL